MNKKTARILSLLIIIGILTTTIVPVLAKPKYKPEKVVIIHYKKGYGKPPGTPGGGPGKNNDGSYELLVRGAKWKTTENLIVDTSNIQGLDPDFIMTTISTSAQTWQSYASYDLYGSITSATSDGVDKISPDDQNEIIFDEISEPGVIAVTIVWGYFNVPPKYREIVEFDMVFDTADFQWGDAEITPTLMDLQNIATHELGHGFGLADLYNPDDNLETMYGYSTEGETIKRSLYYGDIAGIQSLYGAP